jgi:hypothetical protein
VAGVSGAVSKVGHPPLLAACLGRTAEMERIHAMVRILLQKTPLPRPTVKVRYHLIP